MSDNQGKIGVTRFYWVQLLLILLTRSKMSQKLFKNASC